MQDDDSLDNKILQLSRYKLRCAFRRSYMGGPGDNAALHYWKIQTIRPKDKDVQKYFYFLYNQKSFHNYTAGSKSLFSIDLGESP